MRCHAHAFQCVGDKVAGAHDVADAEAGSKLDIDFAGLQFSGGVLVIRPQAGVAYAVPAGIVGWPPECATAWME